MAGAEIAFYYGDNQVAKLAGYRRVVLQANQHTSTQLRWLLDRDVQALGYLSLTEDPGPPQPWQRTEHNPDWGGAFVYVDHPGWVSHVLGQAVDMLRRDFSGLFLDTLNIEFTFPDEVPHLLDLVRRLRDATYPAYLLANRGFGLLPALGELVDGVLFESFSVRWTDDGGYTPWPSDTLAVHAQYAERLRELGVDLYALDYADTAELTEFAIRRASQFHMPCFVSNRELTRL
ncbi:hypothetical protein [Phytohabitans aurantiacus]|jgi:hypothetical protein|uniref:Glycoside-hydrolase family GH114 TIM-barrel domain-containing protein n=1 Tax=Phytohabitans aurantiacus TaxID=3016789 RepID=A0ABQ5QQ55_9ACTN|nr:hypothetical protein [Phytohabitans aurantiacus]GLH95997.1 hypothetical protein Pa4123_12700 [Phytohabitans aurantiacus]